MYIYISLSNSGQSGYYSESHSMWAGMLPCKYLHCRKHNFTPSSRFMGWWKKKTSKKRYIHGKTARTSIPKLRGHSTRNLCSEVRTALTTELNNVVASGQYSEILIVYTARKRTANKTEKHPTTRKFCCKLSSCKLDRQKGLHQANTMEKGAKDW